MYAPVFILSFIRLALYLFPDKTVTDDAGGMNPLENFNNDPNEVILQKGHPRAFGNVCKIIKDEKQCFGQALNDKRKAKDGFVCTWNPKLNKCSETRDQFFDPEKTAVIADNFEDRAHVILIVADDYGWNDVGYHQNAASSANPGGAKTTEYKIQTPTLDRLAAEGRKLENYYVQPVCSPTRGTIMTGRYPSHTGIGPNVIRPTHPYAMPKQEVLMGEKFQSAGYSSHIIGKWHLGLCDERYTPTYRGFDSFRGYLLGAEDYYYHTRTDSGFHGLDMRESANMQNCSNQMPKATDKYKGRYSTDVFVEGVQQIISQRDPNKPTFVYMAFQSVHGPLQAPRKYIDLYPKSMEKNRRTYAGMVSALDDAVANIEKIYKKAGIWDKTVLVFTTDNGGPEHSANNWPLRGHKNTAWEGGIRGVAFVRGTSDESLFPVPAGTSTMELMHSTDWFPTLANVAGYDAHAGLPNPLDGVDQWKVIAKGAKGDRTSIIHNCPGKDQPGNGGVIRLGNYKLMIKSKKMQVLENMEQLSPPGFSPSSNKDSAALQCPPPQSVRGMWLFDVVEDPRECTNLVATHPDEVFKLQQALAEYRKTAVSDLALKYGKSDSASNPSNQPDGAWGPWSTKSDQCEWI